MSKPITVRKGNWTFHIYEGTGEHEGWSLFKPAEMVLLRKTIVLWGEPYYCELCGGFHIPNGNGEVALASSFVNGKNIKARTRAGTTREIKRSNL